MQATQAERVVSAIATILPENVQGRSPQRYLRENEAQDLAAVCEEWLRSVAAEQWNEVLLANLSQVTAACLNALLLAMLDRTQSPPPSQQMPLSLATPPPPPLPYGDNDYSQPMYSTMPAPPPQSPQVDQGAAEMVQILKLNFGNRATELLGAFSVMGGQQNSSITRSHQKQRFLMCQDMQLGLAQLGHQMSMPALKRGLQAVLGKDEPLHVGDLDQLLNSHVSPTPSRSGRGAASTSFQAPPPPPSSHAYGQPPYPYSSSQAAPGYPPTPPSYGDSRTGASGGAPSPYGRAPSPAYGGGADPYQYSSNGGQQRRPDVQPAVPAAKFNPRLASLAARVVPISISDDKSPAPQIAIALAQRLEEHGIGLESAFAALNVGGQPAGVKPHELRSALENVFAIHCPEEVITRFVAWGDISGDGRLRYVEFARLMRSATGYSQIADAPANGRENTYEWGRGAGSPHPSSGGVSPANFPNAPPSPARSHRPSSSSSSSSSSNGGGGSPSRFNNNHPNFPTTTTPGKPTIEAVSEVLYFSAQEPQACGGSGMRAVFKSAAAREQPHNVTKDLRLTAPCLGEYLVARGCDLPQRALESTMAAFGDLSEGLSFSQFMRMMAEASPTRE